MKRYALIFLLVLIPASVLAGESNSFQQLQHAILVNVNSNKITRKNLDDMGLLLFRLNFPDRPLEEVTEKEVAALSAGALRELIIIDLVEDEVNILNSDSDATNDVRVTSEEVSDQVNRMGLTKFIAKPLTMRFAKSQISMDIILQRRGMSATCAPREVLNFYKNHRDDIFVTRRMVKVRHIFLAQDTITPELTKKQAAMLYDELNKLSLDKRAEMFPKMAKNFSQDRFKEKGGLLNVGSDGWFPQDYEFKMQNGKSVFPDGMLRGVRSLTGKGDVKLSKSESGWHILYLEDVKGGVVIPIRKARKYIENFLSQRKVDIFKANWLGDKVDRSNVIWNDGDKFPRDKIVMQPEATQGMEFMRMRIQRDFDKK